MRDIQVISVDSSSWHDVPTVPQYPYLAGCALDALFISDVYRAVAGRVLSSSGVTPLIGEIFLPYARPSIKSPITDPPVAGRGEALLENTTFSIRVINDLRREQQRKLHPSDARGITRACK